MLSKLLKLMEKPNVEREIKVNGSVFIIDDILPVGSGIISVKEINPQETVKRYLFTASGREFYALGNDPNHKTLKHFIQAYLVEQGICPHDKKPEDNCFRCGSFCVYF